jgi:hypothetical protein
MTGPFSFRSLVAAALLASAWKPLAAAPKSASSSSTATLLRPLTLVKGQDMDFGILAVTTAGTAVIDPVTNTESVTGGVTKLGGTPTSALFTGAASGGSVVNIKFPSNSVTLTRVGGTETMTLSNFTLDGPSKRTMAKSASFQFRVGGTLNIAAGQVEGSYVGTFSVTAQYQ